MTPNHEALIAEAKDDCEFTGSIGGYCRESLVPVSEWCLVCRMADALAAPLPERRLRRVAEWTHIYGAALCPPGADTYGNGMREAKRQVALIINDIGQFTRDLREALPEQAPQLDFDVAEYNALQAQVVALRERLEGYERTVDAVPQPNTVPEGQADGCPCTLVEPCMPNCTCANSAMSAGCRRCAKYGSLEQRMSVAKRLAAPVANEAQLRERLTYQVLIKICSAIETESTQTGRDIAARAVFPPNTGEPPEE